MFRLWIAFIVAAIAFQVAKVFAGYAPDAEHVSDVVVLMGCAYLSIYLRMHEWF